MANIDLVDALCGIGIITPTNMASYRSTLKELEGSFGASSSEFRAKCYEQIKDSAVVEGSGLTGIIVDSALFLPGRIAGCFYSSTKRYVKYRNPT